VLPVENTGHHLPRKIKRNLLRMPRTETEKARSRELYALHREARSAKQREWEKTPNRIAYRKAYAEAHKERLSEYKQMHYLVNAELYKKRAKSWERSDPNRTLFTRTKIRATRNGMDFNLTPEDVVIPTVCPVLGIELRHNYGKNGPTDNSPTVDRIDNSKGYVKGNVIIVSFRANRLKSDAAVEELRRVANFYSEVMGVDTSCA